ncbi:MAG: helix-turn-helix domain-containing protein [Paludibacteraceae bacterium]
METEKERIERVMEKEGLNATQFATEIGIKSPTLSHILNGRNNPSLEVLKRILDRYRTISSDWLILGVGPMYRGIKQPQTLSLFEDSDESGRKSASYEEKTVLKNVHENSDIQKKTEQIVPEPQKNEQVIQSVQKLVKKIIVYYNDNTFQEFETK